MPGCRRRSSSAGPSTTAPAPSAKMTAVWRPASGNSSPVRLDLRPDHQDAAKLAGADPGIGHRQSVDESAALRPDVERGNGGDAERR